MSLKNVYEQLSDDAKMEILASIKNEISCNQERVGVLNKKKESLMAKMDVAKADQKQILNELECLIEEYKERLYEYREITELALAFGLITQETFYELFPPENDE